MKYLALIALMTLAASCNENKKESSDEVNSEEIISKENSNGMNTVVTDTEDESTVMMVGKANRNGLQQPPFNTWFSKGYESYKPKESIIEELKPLLKDVKIKAFMGTWCEDSQREIPQFYKILDAANFDYDNLELVTVTHEKDTPTNLEEGLNIDYVPTLIFYRNGKELGRFVEYAQDTIENDILAIVSGKEYQHSYAE